MSKKYYHKTGGYIVNVIEEDKDTVRGAYLNPLTKQAKIATFERSALSETQPKVTNAINEGIIPDKKATPEVQPKPKATAVEVIAKPRIIKGEKGVDITDTSVSFIAKGKTVKNK
jgi:hypothetical protein